MGRTCYFCGDGKNLDKGEPAYYDDIEDYAHVDCAHRNGISD